jgi:hypothetical protein
MFFINPNFDKKEYTFEGVLSFIESNYVYVILSGAEYFIPFYKDIVKTKFYNKIKSDMYEGFMGLNFGLGSGIILFSIILSECITSSYFPNLIFDTEFFLLRFLISIFIPKILFELMAEKIFSKFCKKLS